MEKPRSEFQLWNVRLYHISLLLLLVSIPLSKYTTSLFQFAVLGFWLLYQSDTDYIKQFFSNERSLSSRFFKLVTGFFISIAKSLLEKFKVFFTDKVALIISSILLLHLIGLIYTTDYEYAFKDLRTKLPLFILPLFLSTGPAVNTKTLYWMYIGYALAILAGTIYQLALFANLPVADSRAINSHVSHIRFSLNAVYAIFILCYIIKIKSFFKSWQKIIFGLMSIWFILFMIFMKYYTGISILLLIMLLLVLFKALKGSTLTRRLIFIAGGLLLILAPIQYISSVMKQFRHTEPVDFNQLEKYTLKGNSYYHDTINFRIENGKYIGLYICDKELRQAWRQRSSISIDSLDKKKQALRFTLIRYLASRELRKDSAGISQLTKQDILNIEAGLTNAKNNTGFNPTTQIENFLVGWDNYNHHNNPNSSSLIQRVEYWRTSFILIKQHLLFGVGTGDLPEAFSSQYKRMNSSLDPQFRLRSHNQYLSITIAFGLLGFLWFLFALIYPMISTKKFKSYIYIIFWIIFMLSLFTEDTIETQEGVTFFAYFSSLLLLAWKEPQEY